MKLVIFDFDDTIIDNSLLDIDSFEYVSNLYKLPKNSQKQIIRWRKNGMLADNIFKRILKNRKQPSLEKCVKTRLEYLARGEGLDLIRPKEGAVKTFHEIKKQGNVIVIVTTRNQKRIVKNILKKIRLDKYVDEIFCETDHSQLQNQSMNYVKLKENLYKLALEKTNHKTEKSIVIGNLKSDIIAAKKLKITPFAIKGSYRFDSGISKLAKTIDSLPDVLKFL